LVLLVEGLHDTRTVVLQLLEFCRQGLGGVIADPLPKDLGVDFEGGLPRAERQLLLDVGLAAIQHSVDLPFARVHLWRRVWPGGRLL